MNFRDLIRTQYFPHRWCAGCGNGIVLNAFVHAFVKTGIDREKTVIVSGIGCSGRITQYLNFNTIHTLHGRAIPLATGIKLFRPDLTVVVFMGDGDCLAIGGNHLIHAARRNINLTAIVINNMLYAMTGGQFSPTTPFKKKTKTTPYGNIESPLDLTKIALASGATFVAKYTVYHVKELINGIASALTHKGFSIIEVISTCPTQWKSDPVTALKSLKNLSDIGIKTSECRPEYCELIRQLNHTTFTDTSD